MNQKSKIDLTSPILPARKPINEKQLSSSSSLLPLCKLIEKMRKIIENWKFEINLINPILPVNCHPPPPVHSHHYAN